MHGQGREWIGKRTGNNPKLAQLIIALPCNQIDMMRERELRIKHDTKVADTSRKCYAGEERGQPENVNLCKLPMVTEPYGLSLRGIEKETVKGHPSSDRLIWVRAVSASRGSV